jgi:hypothetical protein
MRSDLCHLAPMHTILYLTDSCVPLQSFFVAGIGMEANAFVGSLPPTFASSNITRIFLQDNKLTGQLTFLDNADVVESLITVDLSLNLFTGQVPSQLITANQMKFFNISMNELTGAMPFDMINLLGPIGELNDLSADCSPANDPSVSCVFCTFCTGL